MSKSAATITNADESDILIEDAADLTAKELAQERLARIEELKKRNWMSHSAEQLASRIPVSVFAMGDLVTGG
ncbi:hypothetical protein GCM10028796_34960 [Ramlibacter monticola]|uniref:Uncharacterized protein n=1 Tax=Ramlibacter monticola TaxID=1926872 RepID=A0A937CXM1_9BURK|nr:hypothetical protein [Ramlibacter monticola]MBL0395283.1 hypothetical protein [Ramlibacter monticola]